MRRRAGTSKLVVEGFRGRILTTGITKELLPILWEDAVRIQEPTVYREADVNRAIARCEGHQYGKILQLGPSCRLRFLDAGHILGSAIVELWWGDRKIVFSGDLGQRGKPIMRDPTIIQAAEALVLESTYGDRNHKALPDTISELGRVIRETQSAGGTVVLPVYAIGRSQDILYVIYQLTVSGVLDRRECFWTARWQSEQPKSMRDMSRPLMKRLPISSESRPRIHTLRW